MNKITFYGVSQAEFIPVDSPNKKKQKQNINDENLPNIVITTSFNISLMWNVVIQSRHSHKITYAEKDLQAYVC